MKILVIHNPFLPVHIGGSNFGGIETFVDAFVRNGLKLGHDIDLIATEDSDIADWMVPEYCDDNRVCSNQFRIFKTEMSSKTKMAEITGESSVRFNYSQIIAIVNKLGLDQYDFVINNTDKVKVASALYAISKKLDCHNVITYLHNLPIWRGSDQTTLKFMSFRDRITFVANSTFTLNRWNNFAKQITNNPDEYLAKCKVDLNIDNITPSDLSYLPENANIKDFAIIGRVIEQKNPVAVKRLANEMKDHNFHFFGIFYAEDKEYLKFQATQTGPNFKFHNKVPIPEKLQFIKDHNLSTLSLAVWETYGITAVESMAMGYPIIVLNNGDNNIRNFILDATSINNSEPNKLPCISIKLMDINSKNDWDYVVCPLGILINRGSIQNIAKSLDDAIKVYNNQNYSSKFIVEWFHTHYMFTNKFFTDLYDARRP